MTEINGKVAVVTGGASGIGRGIAEALIEEGATVVIADIQQDALDAAVAELRALSTLRQAQGTVEPRSLSEAGLRSLSEEGLRSLSEEGLRSLSEAGGRVEGFRVDVTDPQSVEALKDFVLERFGRVDIVCLNAGVGPSGLIKDLTLADWKWIIDVNLWGVIHGVTTFLPVLEANPDGGHIEVTGSNASFVAQPSIGSYVVTKFGVTGLVESLAIELEEAGSKVHLSLLAPGMVHTNIGNSSRNRPDGLEGGLKDVDISLGINHGVRWISPLTAGRITTRAIRNNDLFAPTDPELKPGVEARFQAILAAHDKYPGMTDDE